MTDTARTVGEVLVGVFVGGMAALCVTILVGACGEWLRQRRLRKAISRVAADQMLRSYYDRD